QPGVEAGKKAAAAILDLQTRSLLVLREAGKPMSVSELAEKLGASHQVEAIYKIMRHLHANQRGVVLEGNLAQPSSLMVSING
ncbi:MAG TPA: glucose-6-phosphate isomerase, partial [Cyanobacteria bacterium UBA11149]|nr:glucose-6-phosphate isomerase [Cyanobacteria bacterium UBA11149]